MGSKRTVGKFADEAAEGLMKPLKKIVKKGDEFDDVAKRTDAPTPTPTTPKPKKPIPPGVRKRMEEGNEFNRQREPIYTAKGGGNELTLDNGKRVDSYVPGKEIVSRKHTDLSKVKEDTAIGYLRELDNKYSPGSTLKDTPHARTQIGDDVAKPMRGDPILEVPPQPNGVPENVLKEADRLGITIRDSDGKVYELDD